MGFKAMAIRIHAWAPEAGKADPDKSHNGMRKTFMMA
jgi:hypothetical protein